MFRHAAANEMVHASVVVAREQVEGLRKGKTSAPERPPVTPVSDEDVKATIKELNPVVADMVRLQRLTGMRPGEVVSLRPCDVDGTVDPWKYIPNSHKTEHHGKRRVVFIGPWYVQFVASQQDDVAVRNELLDVTHLHVSQQLDRELAS